MLTVLSLGLYLPLWLGFTWAELRRDTGDERMQPLGHALSVFIPGYGYWQVYRHFSLIGSVLERLGATTRVDPLSATIGVVLWSLTFLHYSNEPIFVAFDMAEVLAATAVVVYGQRALNEYWARSPGAFGRGARAADGLAWRGSSGCVFPQLAPHLREHSQPLALRPIDRASPRFDQTLT